MSLTAERTTLSPITSTVTVAPLTMSTCGGFAVPAATAPRSWSIRPFRAAMIFASGMPTSTIGSWCSTSFSPRTLPSLSMPTTMRIGLPE